MTKMANTHYSQYVSKVSPESHLASSTHLERDRKAPDEIRWTVDTAIVNPVRNQRANGDITSFNANQFPAVVRSTTLRLISRHSRRIDPIPNTGNTSSHNELRSGTAPHRDSRDLNDNPNDHDARTEEDRSASA